MSTENGPIVPALVLCVCGDPASIHRFGNGVCMRVRRGSPCGCEKYEEPHVDPLQTEGPGVAAPRRSLVDEFSVKPKGE